MDYVSRASWGARAPKSRTKIGTVHGIGVHYTYRPRGSADHDRCDDDVRATQDAHIDGKNWSDIAYSWLVCRHGVIYEGRGWGIRTAANGTRWGNDHFHAVCVITDRPISEPAKRAVNVVINEHGRRYQRNDVKGHRDFKATGCPGDEIYAWLLEGRPVPSVPAHEHKVTYGTPMEVDVQIIPLHLQIPTDGNGRGHINIDHHIDKVVSLLPHSEVRPPADKHYDAHPNHVSITPDGNQTMVVVQDEEPNGVAHVWLRVAG